MKKKKRKKKSFRPTNTRSRVQDHRREPSNRFLDFDESGGDRDLIVIPLYIRLYVFRCKRVNFR